MAGASVTALVSAGGGCASDRVDTGSAPVVAPTSTPAGPNPTIPAPSASTSVTAPPGTGAAPVGPVDGVDAVPTAPPTALLDRLSVATVDPAGPDYRRDEFGDGWRYDRTTGCNTREQVLVAESLTPPAMGERCKPLSGDWVSAYDGVRTTDPADLEIDHLVPLAEAWRTGASTWTAERREAFANDLDDPGTLIAVTSRSNRSKGDSPPDRWLPDEPGGRCTYVESWIRVKARWGLQVSPAEKATLVQVLAGC